MKIAVVGTGAMGSVYAGLLADGGNEVWAIDLWREHVEAMRNVGLRVEGASGDRTVAVNATDDFSEPGACDLVILATKASGVGPAAQAMDPLLGEDTLILTIQNGLGAAERISQFRDPGNILIGVAGGFGASMKGPGHVHHNGMQLIRLGEMNGGLTERLSRVEALWNDAGFNVKSFADIHQLIWEKFVCNVSFSGPCTVMRKTIGEICASEHAWGIALRCGLEAHAAGVARGVNFSFDDAATYIRDFAGNMPDARPSMLLDHLAGRRSEIDAINGMVPVVAKEVGTEAPANEVISSIVRDLELAFD
jgi:2-dehydropantoate 2-reductase